MTCVGHAGHPVGSDTGGQLRGHTLLLVPLISLPLIVQQTASSTKRELTHCYSLKKLFSGCLVSNLWNKWIEACPWALTCVYPEVSSLLESLMAGNFEAVLLSPPMVALLSGDGSCREGEDIETYLERRALLYLTSGASNDQTNR